MATDCRAIHRSIAHSQVKWWNPPTNIPFLIYNSNAFHRILLYLKIWLLRSRSPGACLFFLRFIRLLCMRIKSGRFNCSVEHNAHTHGRLRCVHQMHHRERSCNFPSASRHTHTHTICIHEAIISPIFSWLTMRWISHTKCSNYFYENGKSNTGKIETNYFYSRK